MQRQSQQRQEQNQQQAAAAVVDGRAPAAAQAPASSSGRARRTGHAREAENSADSELMKEQFSRNTLFFGDKGQAKVRGSFVVVIGLGGVGSHAAHMLARSGVERLRLVDFDNVTLSSLNRHAVATRDDVGRSKVAVCAERFGDFAPRCQVEVVPCLFNAELADELLAGSPDFVIDAIDDVPTKADLLQACERLGLRAVSCLGAGAKSDPTKLLIGDLSDAMRDPLASKLRYILRQRLKRTMGKGVCLCTCERASDVLLR